MEPHKIHPDLEFVMVDATIVRARACAAGYEQNSQKEQTLGGSVGAVTSKINSRETFN